jgi:hypothetical protein
MYMVNVIVRALICFVALSSATLIAQTSPTEPLTKNEVGLVIGATETPSVGLQRGGNVNLNSSLNLGAEYDRQLIGKHITLLVGIDFLASPVDVKVSYPPSDVIPEYASLFLAPHLKVKFNSQGTFQPWLSFGGGYADFAPAEPSHPTVNVKGDGSTGTLSFGGGLDTRPLLHLKVPLFHTLPIGSRLEVRDFYSGQPHYGVNTSDSLQHNIAFTGGLLIRF